MQVRELHVAAPAGDRATLARPAAGRAVCEPATAALRVGQRSERPSRDEGPSLTPTWENRTNRTAVGVADTAGELGAHRSARIPGTGARRRHRALLRPGLAPPPGGPKLEVLGS